MQNNYRMPRVEAFLPNDIIEQIILYKLFRDLKYDLIVTLWKVICDALCDFPNSPEFTAL